MRCVWLLLLLLSSSQVLLVDEVFTIPAADWRFIELMLQQRRSKLRCDFRVISSGAAVRVALIGLEDLQRMRMGRPPGVLEARPFQSGGRFEQPIEVPGHYALIIESQRAPARVQVRVNVDFSPEVGYLSRQRQLAVIVISFAVFFAIVTYSARRLLKAIR